MTKYTLYVGLNDKETKKQEIKTSQANDIIQKILFINEVEGFTIYKGFGMYKHESGAITKEKTFIIELLDVEEQVINKIIEMLKTGLNQESILKQKQEINIDFK